MEAGSSRIRAVGVMTGTSIDGIDAALVRIEGRGQAMRAALVAEASAPLGDLAVLLRQAAAQTPMSAGAFAKLALDFGQLHAHVIEQLLTPSGESPDLICIHGQTIFHQPPVSWQLVNPAPIAQRFGCPVVSDLRQADLAAGGQGAPITPLADWIMFRHPRHRRAVVNFGGFCNATVLPSAAAGTVEQQLAAICGFDICVCNQLLDAVAREVLGAAFDEDGQAAARGTVQPRAAESLYEMIAARSAGGRSLGTGDEIAEWISAHRGGMAAADLAASAVAGVSRHVAQRVAAHHVDEVIVAGGGARNGALLEAVARQLQRPILPSAALGVPITMREAMAFAILGALCADGVPITLPQVTGCAAPVPLSGVFTAPCAKSPAARLRGRETSDR